MSDKVQVSAVVSVAADTARRLRSQNQPLASFGQRKETRRVEKRGFLGRIEMVDETVQVPVLAPGWPVGLTVPVLQTDSRTVTHEIMLTPNGELAVVRVDPKEMTESRIVSTSVLTVLYTVQCASATAELVPSGDTDGMAAVYPRTVIQTTAMNAAELLIRQLHAM